MNDDEGGIIVGRHKIHHATYGMGKGRYPGLNESCACLRSATKTSESITSRGSIDTLANFSSARRAHL